MVKVINELKEYNRENAELEEWSGDPCLPNPWKGLICSSNNASTVIKEL